MRKVCLYAWASVLFAITPAHAEDQQTIDPNLVHQGIVAGCEYQFNHDPKMASLPAGLGDKLCTCVDNWFKVNGLNDVKSIEENKSVMPQVAVYCMQLLARK